MLLYLIGTVTTVLLLSFAVDGYYYYSSNYKRSNCKIKSSGITTADQLQEALNKAKPGDTISLDPIDYTGDFEVNLDNLSPETITIDGDYQCDQNTRILGGFHIKTNNLVIKDIVFENSNEAILIEGANNINLFNLVINNMKNNAIHVENGNNFNVYNLVIDGVGGNALEFKSVNNVQISSIVISNIKGMGIEIDGNNIQISNAVSRAVDSEVIQITGNNGGISGTVINGDSPNGEAWIRIDGNNFGITGTVGTGSPKNGFLIKGCDFHFDGNICTIGSNGFCIYLTNKQPDCQQNIGWSNLNIGGLGLFN